MADIRSVATTNQESYMDDEGAKKMDGNIGVCGYILMFFSLICVVLLFPLSLIFALKVVKEYERAVIFRLGRVVSGRARGPGLFFVFPCIDHFTKVDLRTSVFNVPPQEILTSDSVTVTVDAVVYCRIFDATLSVTNVEDVHASTQLLGCTTLRTVLGTKDQSHLLSDRETISKQMREMLDDATNPWGMRVERVEIKDVRLPQQLQRAMAAEAEADREARAKVVAAKGEQMASSALKEAADIMSEAPCAMQLRFLQTLHSIAAQRNSTVIFPLPISLLTAFSQKLKAQ